MTQEERRRQMRERILTAACHEFGHKPYAGVSVNDICQIGKFSKGVLYHYYPTKEHLFLACVSLCFQTITEHCKKGLTSSDLCSEQIAGRYFQCRQALFTEQPDLQGLFSQSLMDPPAHLREQIAERKRPFDEMNRSILSRLFQEQHLRAGIGVDDAMMLLELYQTYCNHLPRMCKAEEDAEGQEKLRQVYLDAFLYGVLDTSEPH